MKIGFPLIVKNSFEDKGAGVWGDEIIANACVKLLNNAGFEAFTFQLDNPEKADLCVWLAFDLAHPGYLKDFAAQNVLWLQGFNYKGDDIIPLGQIYETVKGYYDLVVSSSKTLADKAGIPFIIPPIDFDLYKPLEAGFKYDVSFIGNIIKPRETNFRYLAPLAEFNYAIFGGDFGKISHEEWLKTVCSTKVNLHYGFKEGLDWNMVTGSTLFIAACKGFVLSDKVPFLMETFKDAFAFTQGGAEEREQIKQYLEDAEMRNKMISRAYEVVRSLNYNQLVEVLKGA